VTILERPLHPASLISAARSALRGRLRQRLAAEHLEERETARAALRNLADTLETKVEERTRDLAAANDRLTAEIADRERAEARLIQAQKMEAVGQLTGGLAHDFNNLLTAVVGSLDLLLRRTDDEKLRRLARNALTAAERGAQLTAQLLAFSRRQRLTPSAVDPNEVISGTGDMLARTIGPHIRVETQLDPHLWQAMADRTQIEVMILNLAINARDAMAGGGRLTISTRNVPAVPAELAGELTPGEYIAIAVTDTGTGMSSSVLAKAFEPFFTTKEQAKVPASASPSFTVSQSNQAAPRASTARKGWARPSPSTCRGPTFRYRLRLRRCWRRGRASVCPCCWWTMMTACARWPKRCSRSSATKCTRWTAVRRRSRPSAAERSRCC
jgi:C4-dicarboxylate-specific signal transduction histidine kinase